MIRIACVSFARFAGRDNRSFAKTGNLINHAVRQRITPSNYGIVRPFHATPRRLVHPIVLALLKPFSRFGSMISGKFIRNWWTKLPPEKRLHYKTNYLYNPLFWAIPAGLFTVAGGIFYYTHLEVAPITNRKRFIGLSHNALIEISNSQLESQLEEVKDKIVDEKDPVYARVRGIVERMVKSNEDVEKLKTQEWNIHVIDDKISNAFVLPNGHIFVYTGLMNMVNNDDQLAFILGHEMSHALLSHGAENISYNGIINVFIAVFMTVLWTIVPGNIMAGAATYLHDKIFEMVFNLPYNRDLELEADKVGLHLVSRACYDVRESSVFWRNWAVIEAMDEVERTPEYLSTHPTHENRAKELDKLIPEALDKRRECKCPELKETLSKVDFNLLQALIKETKTQKKEAAAAALAK